MAGDIYRNGDLNGDGDSADTNENTGGVYEGKDSYVSVFNSAGTLQWSKRLGGTGDDPVYSLDTDSAYHVVASGALVGTGDINGDGDTSDTNETGNAGVYGIDDAFISVFDSVGTFVWSKRLGGTGADNINETRVAGSNDVASIGVVLRNGDLNGDADTADTNETGQTGVYGGSDIFVSVFNSAGTFQWSKRLGGTGTDTGEGINFDSSDDIAAVGYVNRSADLNGDGDTGDSNETGNMGVYGGDDFFLSVFNSAGTFQWSKRLGGTGTERGYGSIMDSAGNVRVIGYVNGNVDLTGDADTGDSGETGSGIYGANDIFISGFNSAGTFQWAKRLGGTGSDTASKVTVDSSDRVIVVGYVNANGDLNGDGDTADTNEGGGGPYLVADVFISVFDSAGTFQWSKRLGGTAGDQGMEVAVDNNDNILIAGQVTGNSDIDGDGLVTASYAFYQSGYEDEPVQITTTGKAITMNTTTGDDIDTSPVTVTGLAGVTGNTSWPNGYAAFYMMKYELTQGQYKDFLNSLRRAQQINRVQATISGDTIANYYVMADSTLVDARQSIRAPASGNGTSPAQVVFGCDLNNNGTFNETDDGDAIAMNYINWMDYSAYADWAGLRPITDLEYEKAARGPNSAVYGEYAWGTTTITSVSAITNSGRGSETASNSGEGLANYSGGPLRVGFAATNATNRKSAGAGYYGNMDLTGNVVEFAVPLGNSVARLFQGTHGDGTLTATATYEGNATNNDWLGIDATTARGVTHDGSSSANHSATYRGGDYNSALTTSASFLGTYNIGFGLSRRYNSPSGGRFARTAP